MFQIVRWTPLEHQSDAGGLYRKGRWSEFCYCDKEHSRMSQYGTQPDPAKMWGLMGSAGADGGGVTPLVPSTPSVPQKPLSSPYNGLPGPGYRTVNGNRTSANQNSSHHSLHHWSSGIRLPTAPQGAWDQFRPSGQHSTAYLNSPPLPTSITPQAGIQPQQQQQAQQHLQQASSGWYPGAGIPTQKLPHRPYPGIHIMQEEHQNSLQQQETAITNPIPAYLNPFSSSPVSAQDMTMLAAAAAAQSRAETATSVPAQTQVYLPTPQSAPPASVVSSPLGEFLPPPSAATRINAYSPATSSLELDVLRNLHQQTPGQSLQPLLAQAQGQPSPQKLPRQFWSPPAGQLPSLMGSFPTSSLGSPTSGRGCMTAVKSEMPFSPAQSQQQEDLVHSTTGGSAGGGLLAVRQPVTPTGYGMTTITGRSSQQSSGGEVGSPGCRRNGLSPSQRVSNCAQDVTTTVPTTVSCSMSSPQYQQISPAISTTSEQATTATGSEVSEGLSPGKAGGGRSQSGPTVVVTTSCAQVSSRTQGLNSPTSLPRGQSSSSSAAQTPASAPGTPTSLGSSSDSTSRLCVDFSGSSSNGISGLKTTAEDSVAGSVCGGVIMAPKVEPGAETVTQAQFFDNPNKAKSTLTPDQEGNFPESTFEGNTNGKADSIEEVNNLGADNQSQKEKVEQSQSARSPQGENAFKQGLIRTKSERPDVYDFQPEGEEGDQEPTSRSPPPTLESERSPQENGNDGEDALMMEPDDDGSGKPLVVDTELHEPITPEELSPEASNNSLPPGYLGPEAAEMNRKASLLLERKIQSEGGQGVLLSGAFVPSVTSVTRPPGLRPPLGFPLISPSQPLSANSSLKISPAGNVSSSAGGQSTYTCPICGFTSTSKFHFNSHMNTHTDHQCSMCDYTARTEGRLKRHMKEFHSPAEQMAAGVTPSGELMDTLPSSSGEGRGTPSALEQMQQALARSQEVFAQHQLNPESGGSGSDTGTPPKDGERKQSTSHKPKHYRCKQCTHMSTSKEESWQHARSHIKPDKLLSCPQCEFVTEYKHHLEYHLRNHFGSKPFRCNKCNYSCVNKSMLNSHMKSHSSFYQFRCRDCTYATKYCHSLKLHLRKYGHHPANVDLPDGTSLDTTAIDVYGNRRGPRPKKSDSASPPFVSPLTVTAAGSMFPSSEPSPVTPNPVLTGGLPSLVPPNILEALRFQQNLGAMAKSIATLGAQLPTVQSDAAGADNAARAPESASGASTANQKCQMCGYRSTSQQDFVQHVFMHKLETVNLYSSAAASTAAAAALLGQSANAGPGSQSAEGSEEHSPSAVGRMSPSVTGEGSQASSGSPISGSKGSGDEGSGGAGGEQPPGGSSRRKGKAYKLDRIALRLQQAGRMSPSPSSGGQEDPEVMDVQAQEQEEHVEQSELGMETVESVVQNVIRAQPQSLVPSKSTGSGTSGSGEGGTTTTPTTTTATSAQSGPGAAHTLLEALKGAMENRQREGTPGEEKSEGSGRKEIDWQCAFKCDHCQIAFMNEVMYHIHMGYHGYDNPFRCNRCGELCKDSLGMFMHIAQAKH